MYTSRQHGGLNSKEHEIHSYLDKNVPVYISTCSLGITNFHLEFSYRVRVMDYGV
jgi:hypothetical protein